eukprot:1063586_1
MHATLQAYTVQMRIVISSAVVGIRVRLSIYLVIHRTLSFIWTACLIHHVITATSLVTLYIAVMQDICYAGYSCYAGYLYANHAPQVNVKGIDNFALYHYHIYAHANHSLTVYCNGYNSYSCYDTQIHKPSHFANINCEGANCWHMQLYNFSDLRVNINRCGDHRCESIQSCIGEWEVYCPYYQQFFDGGRPQSTKQEAQCQNKIINATSWTDDIVMCSFWPIPTMDPTQTPTLAPTSSPTSVPSSAPSLSPTSTPTSAPTDHPTGAPTYYPTLALILSPTYFPSDRPSVSHANGPSSISIMSTANPSGASFDSTVTSTTEFNVFASELPSFHSSDSTDMAETSRSSTAAVVINRTSLETGSDTHKSSTHGIQIILSVIGLCVFIGLIVI